MNWLHDSFSLGKIFTLLIQYSCGPQKLLKPLSYSAAFGLHYKVQGVIVIHPVMCLHLTKCFKLLVNDKQLSNPDQVIRIRQMPKVKNKYVFQDWGSGECIIVLHMFSIKHKKKIWIFKIPFDILKSVGILAYWSQKYAGCGWERIFNLVAYRSLWLVQTGRL